MIQTAATVDPNRFADGHRAPIGTVGVDGGQMCISADPRDPRGPFALEGDTGSFQPRLVGRAAVCTSGFGDGGYAVHEVVRDNRRVGIEAVFLSPVVDACADRLVEQKVADGTAVRPASDAPAPSWDDPGYEQAMDARDAWESAMGSAYQAAQGLLSGMHPSQEADPLVLGTIRVGGTVGVGDPCYGSPSKTFRVPAGDYLAVAWQRDMGEFWGTRVVRLGIYRAEG